MPRVATLRYAAACAPLLQRWEGQRGTGWTYVPPARDLIGMTRGEIGTSIKREATMRMSARHRTAIREAAEKTARLEADPLGRRVPTGPSFSDGGERILVDLADRLAHT